MRKYPSFQAHLDRSACSSYPVCHSRLQSRDAAGYKRQHTAFVLRLGKQYTGGKSLWTENHLKWLRGLDLTLLEKETLQEYLITYDYLTDKLERLDARIEELARNERYGERVHRLGCFIGIKPHTALSLLVEVGDFRRFEKAPNFAGFLGLVPAKIPAAGAETALPSRKRATVI